MRNVGRVAVVVGLLATTLIFGGRAQAACHAFTVSAAPANPSEGGRVTVTVSRDGAVNPSSVRVSTIDETARAPSDYTRLNQDVQFDAQTSRTFTVSIHNDATPEGPETFKLHLSNPDGCQANTNYSLGPDVRVTIGANDATPKPTNPPAPAPPPVTTAPPSTTVPPSASPSPSPSASPSESPSEEPTESPFTFATPEESAGGSAVPALAVIGILAGLGVAGFGGYLLWKRSRGA